MKLFESETVGHCEDLYEILLLNPHCEVGMIVLAPGQPNAEYGTGSSLADRLHYVIEGEGEALVELEPTRLGKGDMLWIEAGEKHQITGAGNRAMRILRLSIPSTR